MFGDRYRRPIRTGPGRKTLAISAAVLLLLGMSTCFPGLIPVASGTSRAPSVPRSAGFPVVDPNYIYQELYTLVTHDLHREAGYDTNLPPTVNGHDEFAAAWSEEMVRDLAGFGPQVRIDSFPISGWSGRPAKTSAFNVEVTVPGVSDPANVVVIGCHYDGEAISTQSANDDASGCAIELGVARALATYWRIGHLYPARTLRFVIFDAEEQGVYGSFHYLNSTINGDTGHVVAMFNEEQSGIAYPLRYLGKTSNPLLPFYAYLSPLASSQLYPNQGQLPAADLQRINQFRQLMGKAVAPVFAAFQSLGYQSLIYHGNNDAPVSQPVFAPNQTSNVEELDDTIGSSDQIAFTMAGVPSATFVGNATYYDTNPPPWSYPYDQSQDTIQLMNVFANGSIQQSQALTLALALPGMLTTWMLNQPSILGSVPLTTASDGSTPIAAISDIGLVEPGLPLQLDARASYDPGVSSSLLGYHWSFGDGATASGILVTHTYKLPGTYTLTLAVTAPNGPRSISKTITVSSQPVQYANPYAGFPQNGSPPSNPLVQLPALRSQPVTSSNAAPSSRFPAILILVLIVIGVAVLLIVLTLRRSRRPAS
jgi:hypothetical protein